MRTGISAPILLRQQLRQRQDRQDTVRDIKAEVLAVERYWSKRFLHLLLVSLLLYKRYVQLLL